MNLRTLVRVVFAITVMLPLQTNTVECGSELPLQEGALNKYKVVSEGTYTRVLDSVFPRDQAKGDYGFALRFKPSFAPESQIVIRRALNKVEVVEYTSLSGNIYRNLDSIMAHGGKEDAVEMAKLIQVKRRSIEVPIAQVKMWHSSLLNSISASVKTFKQRGEESERGIGTLRLDGTFYDLWYNQGIGDISFSVYDQEISDREVTGELKLVRWMNTVRLDIGKSK